MKYASPEKELHRKAGSSLPVVAVSAPVDLWLCGGHRVLCGDATNAAAVARLLGTQAPLLVTDRRAAKKRAARESGGQR